MRVVVNARSVALQAVNGVADDGLEEIAIAWPFLAISNLVTYMGSIYATQQYAGARLMS